MRIQIHHQGLEQSQWMDQLLTKKVIILYRYLSPSSKVDICLKSKGASCRVLISIFSPKHNFEYFGDGELIYEAFSNALEKARRELASFRRKEMSKVFRKLGDKIA